MTGIIEQQLAATLKTNELLAAILEAMGKTPQTGNGSTQAAPVTQAVQQAPVTQAVQQAPGGALDIHGMPVPAEAVDRFDSSGRPWDSIIDSSNGKTLAKSGLWQKKKGANDLTRSQHIAANYPNATAPAAEAAPVQTAPPVAQTAPPTTMAPPVQQEQPVLIAKIEYQEGLAYDGITIDLLAKWQIQEYGIESLKLICTRICMVATVQDIEANPQLHAMFHQWCNYGAVTEEFLVQQGR